MGRLLAIVAFFVVSNAFAVIPEQLVTGVSQDRAFTDREVQEVASGPECFVRLKSSGKGCHSVFGADSELRRLPSAKTDAQCLAIAKEVLGAPFQVHDQRCVAEKVYFLFVDEAANVRLEGHLKTIR